MPDENQRPENDDLLLRGDNRRHVLERHAVYEKVIDFAELRNAFEENDKASNKARNNWRSIGLFTILLALFALYSAALEPLYHKSFANTASFVSGVGAVAGVVAVLAGLIGILQVSEKKKWLINRFRTERLRQFYFQSIVYFAASSHLRNTDEDDIESFSKSLLQKYLGDFNDL